MLGFSGGAWFCGGGLRLGVCYEFGGLVFYMMGLNLPSSVWLGFGCLFGSCVYSLLSALRVRLVTMMFVVY